MYYAYVCILGCTYIYIHTDGYAHTHTSINTHKQLLKSRSTFIENKGLYDILESGKDTNYKSINLKISLKKTFMYTYNKW